MFFRRQNFSSIGSSSTGDTPQPDEFNLNSGKAIDTLKEEWPDFFSNGLQDYAIYHDNILLHEPYHYKFFIRGIRWYRSFMWSARAAMNWYFTDLKFSIHHLHRQEQDLVVRWKVEGTSRASLLKHQLFSFVSPDAEYIEREVYEGTFRYRFNDKGIITEHVVENIIPAPRKIAPLHAISWWQRGKLAGELELNSRSIE